jgi:hypothetical protein
MMMMMMMMILSLFGQLGLWAPPSGVQDVFILGLGIMCSRILTQCMWIFGSELVSFTTKVASSKWRFYILRTYLCVIHADCSHFTLKTIIIKQSWTLISPQWIRSRVPKEGAIGQATWSLLHGRLNCAAEY